ncbi:MAG: UDP-N-acetylglucosamine--LPS N-acetylglucosamine transferase, partial [Planctomycetota bacterium]
MVDDAKKLHVCLVSSAGGHTTQLLELADSWRHSETCWVTTGEVVKKKLSEYGKVYIVGECNRQQPLRVLKVFIRCVRIVLSERPDVVISTGAAAGAIVCCLSKLLGAKIVWIDSITNVYKLSLSGRLVRRIADLFLVQ